jgi:hypothetical protein
LNLFEWAKSEQSDFSLQAVWQRERWRNLRVSFEFCCLMYWISIFNSVDWMEIHLIFFFVLWPSLWHWLSSFFLMGSLREWDKVWGLREGLKRFKRVREGLENSWKIQVHCIDRSG